MSIYDKTDRWDDENAGRPLPPTRQQLEARINELEAELDKQRSWEGAAHEYEEQARFARAERDRLKAALTKIDKETGSMPYIQHIARAALSGEGVKPVDTSGNDDTAATLRRGF